ncbi:MAG: hypothetical protein AAGG00_13605, partial [Cyanobacteria bacterium P01_H01_bin.150]
MYIHIFLIKYHIDFMVQKPIIILFTTLILTACSTNKQVLDYSKQDKIEDTQNSTSLNKQPIEDSQQNQIEKIQKSASLNKQSIESTESDKIEETQKPKEEIQIKVSPKQNQKPVIIQSFVKWCKQKNTLPEETKYTVELLLKEAGTQDCNQANQILSKLTELRISKKNISDIQPIASFTNLNKLSL